MIPILLIKWSKLSYEVILKNDVMIDVYNNAEKRHWVSYINQYDIIATLTAFTQLKLLIFIGPI